MAMSRDSPTLLWALMTLLVVTSSCGGLKVIDLTHQLKEGEIITWPVNPKFNFSILHRGPMPLYKNYWLENNQFQMAEHMGTHMDAPSHFGEEGKWRMHQIPPERLAGPGVVIDVKDKVKKDPSYQLTVKDVEEWEAQHGRIPDKAVVLVNVGWAIRYPDKKLVFNSKTDDLMDLNSFIYPTVTGEAATWLADNRNIIALGIDSPGADNGKDFEFPVHTILLPRNVLLLENVANLNSMPATGTTVVMGGLNIWDGSGAPMRLLAFSGGWKPQGWSSVSLAVLSLTLPLTTRRLGL